MTVSLILSLSLSLSLDCDASVPMLQQSLLSHQHQPLLLLMLLPLSKTVKRRRKKVALTAACCGAPVPWQHLVTAVESSCSVSACVFTTLWWLFQAACMLMTMNRSCQVESAAADIFFQETLVLTRSQNWRRQQCCWKGVWRTRCQRQRRWAKPDQTKPPTVFESAPHETSCTAAASDADSRQTEWCCWSWACAWDCQAHHPCDGIKAVAHWETVTPHRLRPTWSSQLSWDGAEVQWADVLDQSHSGLAETAEEWSQWVHQRCVSQAIAVQASWSVTLHFVLHPSSCCAVHTRKISDNAEQENVVNEVEDWRLKDALRCQWVDGLDTLINIVLNQHSDTLLGSGAD